MPENFYPAISTFEIMASPGSSSNPYSQGIAGVDDNIELHVAPSGVSVRGRYWREGRYFKAVVHVQAAGMSPKTISAQIDLKPIAKAMNARRKKLRNSGVEVSGWPGSFMKAVSKIGKSKLMNDVSKAVKSVVRSKVTGAVVGAAAVVFPAVGVPAAAAYATANAAITALDKAKAAKQQAQQILATGSPEQIAALKARAGDIADTLSQAADVKSKLRDIADRAQQGDTAARKTARIFSHVMAHRRRVEEYGASDGSGSSPGTVVSQTGRGVPANWLLAAAAQQGVPLLASASGSPLLAAAARAGQEYLSSFSGGGTRTTRARVRKGYR